METGMSFVFQGWDVEMTDIRLSEGSASASTVPCCTNMLQVGAERM